MTDMDGALSQSPKDLAMGLLSGKDWKLASVYSNGLASLPTKAPVSGLLRCVNHSLK